MTLHFKWIVRSLQSNEILNLKRCATVQEAWKLLILIQLILAPTGPPEIIASGLDRFVLVQRPYTECDGMATVVIQISVPLFVADLLLLLPVDEWNRERGTTWKREKTAKRSVLEDYCITIWRLEAEATRGWKVETTEPRVHWIYIPRAELRHFGADLQQSTKFGKWRRALGGFLCEG